MTMIERYPITDPVQDPIKNLGALSWRGRDRGNSTVMTIGFTIVTLVMGVLAVDLPMYYVYQNQLQTAVNAAALAGAAELPLGVSQAEEAAVEIAALNPVAGQELSADNLEFTFVNAETMTMEVSGTAEGPTMFAKLSCAMQSVLEDGGGFQEGEGGGEEGEGSGSSGSCESMTIHANAKAVPAARDTMLVMDVSGSMLNLGGNRPLNDVKDAAEHYVELIADFNSESVDRIGYVTFGFEGELIEGLTDQNQDPDFNDMQSTISSTWVYNGNAGWNTNYPAPLRIALDELEANGRTNAEQIIIFMTDGYANLEPPNSFYDYNYYNPRYKCYDIVNQSSNLNQYKSELCTWDRRRRRWRNCKRFPSSRVKDYMIPANAVSCAEDYVGNIEDTVKAQVDRAKAMGVTIHVVSIREDYSSSWQTLQRLLKDPDYDMELLEYMTGQTDGTRYDEENYDAQGIQDVYQEIAEDVHIKLSI